MSRDLSHLIKTSGFGTRLEFVIGLNGGFKNAKKIAAVEETALRRHVAEAAQPRFWSVIKLAFAAGVSPHWIATDSGDVYIDGRSDQVSEDNTAELRYKLSTCRNALADKQQIIDLQKSRIDQLEEQLERLKNVPLGAVENDEKTA